MKKFVFYGGAVVVIAAVAGLYYTGVLNWGQTRHEARAVYYKGKGAVAGFKKGAQPNSPEKAAKCRENLKLIESAKRRAADRLSQVIGEVVRPEILKELGMKELPKCPSGGSYILGPVGVMGRCTIGGSATTDPIDDHLAPNY